MTSAPSHSTLALIAAILGAWGTSFFAYRLRRMFPYLLLGGTALTYYFAQPGWRGWLAIAAAAWHGKRVRVWGLTGTIASGKSTFARALAEGGAHVVDADALARKVVLRGNPAYDEIVARFGARVVDTDTRELNRSVLREIIMSDAAARKFVNRATHMRVARMMFEEIVTQRWLLGKTVVLDVPLLFETGGWIMRLMCSPIIVVTAPRDAQIERVMARDGVTRESAERTIDAQMPQEEKVRRADIVVRNDADKVTLERRAQALLRELQWL